MVCDEVTVVVTVDVTVVVTVLVTVVVGVVVTVVASHSLNVLSWNAESARFTVNTCSWQMAAV